MGEICDIVASMLHVVPSGTYRDQSHLDMAGHSYLVPFGWSVATNGPGDHERQH